MTNNHYSAELCVDPHRLVAGFTNPNEHLSGAVLKVVSTRLRARMIAVQAWDVTGQPLTHTQLADQLAMSGRWLSYQFVERHALYAFPPPELAHALTGATAGFTSFAEVAAHTRPVFAALDANPHGRALIAGLVRLHRAQPELCASDGYFAHALRNDITRKRARHTLAITGLFTDGIRTAFEDWVDNGQPSLQFVAERAANLLEGPVQQAYEALNHHHHA